jgi:hypothetical protein
MITPRLCRSAARRGDFCLGVASPPERNAHGRHDSIVEVGSARFAFVLSSDRDDRIAPLIGRQSIELSLGTCDFLCGKQK